MELKPGLRDLLWMAAGALLLLVLVVVVMHYQGDETSAARLQFKTERLVLVERMRYSLAVASEAEKSAVLAVTDQDSQAFAEQSQGATVEVVRARQALSDLLAANAIQKEKLLASFSEAFAVFQRIDRDLLALAVKNTNVKAFALTFGPAAQAVTETDSALSRFLATQPRRATSCSCSLRAHRRRSCDSTPDSLRTLRSRATRKWMSLKR